MTVSVFVTTCDTLGVTVVVVLVGSVTTLLAVVEVLIPEVPGVLVAEDLATVNFCLLVTGTVTAVVNC